MFVSCECSVMCRLMSVWQADHSSSGIPSNLVCLSVVVKFRQ